MISLIVLLLIEFVILFFCILISRGDVMSPQFGFIACFIPSSAYALFWVERWNLDMSGNTLFIISTGLVCFLIVSLLTAEVCNRLKKYISSNPHTTNTFQDDLLDIKQGKIILIFAMQIVSLILTIRFLITEMGSTNLSAAIYYFRIHNMASSDDYVSLPAFTRMIRRICLASGYIVSYLLVHGIVYNNKKNRYLELICVILTLLNSVMLGARGDAVQILLAAIIQFFLISRFKNGWSYLNLHTLLKIILLVIILILSFAQIGEFLGRGMSRFNLNEYIAIYLSAELKNLDTFIRQGSFGTDILHSRILYNVTSLFTNLFSRHGRITLSTNPFYYINGYELGNVGTIFYTLMQDAGYLGVIIYISIMAIICQITYQRIIVTKVKNNISLDIVFYSYIWGPLILSFFSNKFYENLLSNTFLWSFISWVFLRWFLLKMDIKFAARKCYKEERQ